MADTELKKKFKYYLTRSHYDSQEELAGLLNVAPSTLSKWLSGANPWDTGRLSRACELLELNENETRELFQLANLTGEKTELGDATINQTAGDNAKQVGQIFGDVTFN
ncbi:MAG: helix-turn-helix transcriptional regulator [Anaerolineae bacterium]|nr:helix-turn-helix transcriptional regulator [Anaerolineae bacterium]